MSISSLSMRSAAMDLLNSRDESLVGSWFAWYTCAFLFGAAAGGFLFGWVGDRFGRARALALSMLCYGGWSAVAYFVRSPEQLLVARFLCCMGVGGAWPNGVALVSETWSRLSKPAIAGIIGSAANVGILGMSALCGFVKVTDESWRWTQLVGAIPLAVVWWVWWCVPESPKWLTGRQNAADPRPARAGLSDVFRPPFLKITLIGIVLGTVPIVGGWGTQNWFVPWAEQAGEAANPPNPHLKAWTLFFRSSAGAIGSLLGGWLASRFGRRTSYFLISLGSLICGQYIFWQLVPTDPSFLYWVAAIGFISTMYFGWLPLCLPELFPTRVRSTGAGVSFNFGRVFTGFAVLGAGTILALFDGSYPQIGRATSLFFGVGMLVIWLAPARPAEDL